MAVKIRLRRMGSKNAAFYRVIVQDARRTPTGRFIETLGWYDPKQEGNNFSLNLDRADYWLGNGAQPSDTVASLIKKARTLPVEQAVVGEVTEEEIPVAAIEEEAAEETVEEVVAEEEAPAAVEEVVAEEEAPAAVEKVIAEEEAPAAVEEVVAEEESEIKEPVAEEVAKTAVEEATEEKA